MKTRNQLHEAMLSMAKYYSKVRGAQLLVKTLMCLRNFQSFSSSSGRSEDLLVVTTSMNRVILLLNRKHRFSFTGETVPTFKGKECVVMISTLCSNLASFNASLTPCILSDFLLKNNIAISSLLSNSLLILPKASLFICLKVIWLYFSSSFFNLPCLFTSSSFSIIMNTSFISLILYPFFSPFRISLSTSSVLMLYPFTWFLAFQFSLNVLTSKQYLMLPLWVIFDHWEWATTKSAREYIQEMWYYQMDSQIYTEIQLERRLVWNLVSYQCQSRQESQAPSPWRASFMALPSFSTTRNSGIDYLSPSLRFSFSFYFLGSSGLLFLDMMIFTCTLVFNSSVITSMAIRLLILMASKSLSIFSDLISRRLDSLGHSFELVTQTQMICREIWMDFSFESSRGYSDSWIRICFREMADTLVRSVSLSIYCPKSLFLAMKSFI